MDIANKLKADYIVCGKRGLSALEAAVMGSTSNYLVKHSAIPVVVVPSFDIE